MRVDDPYQMIALNQLEQFGSIYKFGRNANVGATEVIIAAGGIYGLPTVARTVTVTSSVPASDNPTGIGARTVQVFGLDSNYDEIDEIIPLAGTSTKTFLRIYRAFVKTSGNTDPTNGSNLGVITITQTVSATQMIRINQYDGQTLCACYTVPRGITALLWSADTTVGAGKNSTNRLKTRGVGTDEPFTTKGIRDNFENSVGIKYKIPRTIEEKTDIVFTALSTAAGTAVSGTFLLQLFNPTGG